MPKLSKANTFRFDVILNMGSKIVLVDVEFVPGVWQPKGHAR